MIKAMATPPIRPIADKRAQSLDLTRRHGYWGSGPARTLRWTLYADGRLASLAVRVPSATSDREYIITYQAVGEVVSCDCPAGSHGRPCWHAGCGLAAGRQVARIYGAQEGHTYASLP